MDRFDQSAIAPVVEIVLNGREEVLGRLPPLASAAGEIEGHVERLAQVRCRRGDRLTSAEVGGEPPTPIPGRRGRLHNESTLAHTPASGFGPGHSWLRSVR